MPMTIRDHAAQLISRYQSCEMHMADALTWQAAILVYNEHPWSFCVKEGQIVTEAQFSDGTVALTSGSTAVVLTGAVWDTTWVNRRFKGYGRAEEYAITITSPTTATLAVNWNGDTQTAATYSIFRDTYSVPADCDYGREYFILDPARNRMIRFKDLGVFIRAKSGYLYGGSGYPVWATRVAETAAGVPQLRLGPTAPSTVEIYPMIYYAAPQRTTISAPITPLIPAPFEDLIWRRARWLYAEEKGKAMRERDDLRRIYYDRFGDAVKACDGGAEVERYINSNYPSVAGDWMDYVQITYTGAS